MALRERIREMMQATGWSQAELARQAHVSRSAVNQWLDGSSKSLDATVGFALQKVSGFSAQWLLTGEGTKTHHQGLTSIRGGKERPEIDLVLLKDSIQGVELYLKEEREQASLEKKATLIALVFEHSLDAGRVDSGAVRRILRLVS